MELLINSNLILMAFFVNILVHVIQKMYTALTPEKELKPFTSRIIVMIMAFIIGGVNFEHGTSFSGTLLTDCVAILVTAIALYHFGYQRVFRMIESKIEKKLL